MWRLRPLWVIARYDGLVSAAICIVLFLVALVADWDGPIWALLPAAVFHLAISRWFRHQAEAAQRHRTLRAARLARERAGLQKPRT